MIKKNIALGVLLIMTFSLFACNNTEPGVIEWTNDNAIYVTIKPEYIDEIYGNVSRAFQKLNLKATLITQRTGNKSLKLLLVLAQSGKSSQASAIETLLLDQRVATVHACEDAKFEPESTLSLSSPFAAVKVGETLTVTRTGDFKYFYYNKGSDFDVIELGLTNADPEKEYTTADFPQVKLVSVEKLFSPNISGVEVSLLLTLEKPGYFNLFNAINALASYPNVTYIGMSYYFVDPYFPYWKVSDTSVADFANVSGGSFPDYEGYMPMSSVETERGVVHIQGLKPGKVTLLFSPMPLSFEYLNITLEIEVVE